MTQAHHETDIPRSTSKAKSAVFYNAEVNKLDEHGRLQLENDHEATRRYFLDTVNQNTVFFHSLEEKLDYLVDEGYYEAEVLEQYHDDFIKELFKRAYDYHFRFQSYLGAYKFYTSYALKTFDGSRWLERFEDRVVMNALYLARGDEEQAENLVDEMMTGRYQPATPTFLNAGRQQRGEMVSCFPAGTKVTVADGVRRPIEDIKVGDKVLTHTGVLKRVYKTIENDNMRHMVTLRPANGLSVTMTEDHPVLVYADDADAPTDTLIDSELPDEDGYRWVRAGDVRVGKDAVVFFDTEGNKALLPVGGKEFSEPVEKVYNLEVEDDHTYVAEGIVVHNCFLGLVGDSMEDIARTVQNALQLSKRGGGVSFNLSNLREKGAPIKKIENQSSGVIPVMKLLEDSFSYANQLGARQGAGAVYLNAHHPDILDFLDTKRENADEKVRIKSLSIGVVIPDVTIQLAQQGKDMYLFSPYDVSRVYDKPFTDVNITEVYDELVGNPEVKKKKISARELLTTIASLQFESGYPYIVFEDNVNRPNPIAGKISFSNLCVTGDTRILTDKGYRRMDDLYETQEAVRVQSDRRAVTGDLDQWGIDVKDSSPVFKTGQSKPVYEVTTLEGHSIRATDYHKFIVADIDSGRAVEKRLHELEPGDMVLLQGGEGVYGDVHQPDLAYLAGLITTDGTFEGEADEDAAVCIHLQGGKATEAEKVSAAVRRVLEGYEDAETGFVRRGDDLVLESAPLAKLLADNGYDQDTRAQVPEFVWAGDKETQTAYLSALFQMSGFLTGEESRSSMEAELVYPDTTLLREVQTLLLNMSIDACIYPHRKSGAYTAPNEDGDMEEHELEDMPALRFISKGFEQVMETFEFRTIQRSAYDALPASPTGHSRHAMPFLSDFTATVKDIALAGVEDVYDVTVEDGHRVIFAGYVTSNCSEILEVSELSSFNEDGSYAEVGKDISCNLGSLNVAQTFDSPDFGKTVETAIRALTSVSDQSNIASVPSIDRGNKLSHAIGLGQMNLHGFFGREHIYYDSKEAVDFTNIYFLSVLYAAIRASNQIARERGETFYRFEDSKYATGEFFEKYITRDWGVPKTAKVAELLKKSTMYVPTVEDWKALRDDVMEYGLYNQNLQAVPPTGSISYINHSTSSIHPVSSRIERRKEGKLGTVYYPQPHLDNDNVQYFQDAFELGPKAVLRIYAAATEHVDQGLSMTMFYDDTATVSTLVKTYLRAWKMGIKTMYYARLRQRALSGTEMRGLASSLAVGKPGAVADPNATVLAEDGDVCVSCTL